MVLPGGGAVPLVGGLPLGQMVPNAAGGKPQVFTTARLPQQQVTLHFRFRFFYIGPFCAVDSCTNVYDLH